MLRRRAAEAAIGGKAEARQVFARDIETRLERRHRMDGAKIDVAAFGRRAPRAARRIYPRWCRAPGCEPNRRGGRRLRSRRWRDRWSGRASRARKRASRRTCRSRNGSRARRRRADASIAARPARCGFRSRFVRRLRGARDGLDLPGHVPLDREVLRRDVFHDHVELGGERFLEAGADALDVFRIGEIKPAHDAVDHRDRDLKTQPGGQQALLAQRLEDKVGGDASRA